MVLDWRQDVAKAREVHLYRHAKSTRYFAREIERLSTPWNILHGECW